MYTQLNDDGRALVMDLSQRTGFSQDAVEHMLWAVSGGGGTMAQFNHYEFGGMGQWSMGGMIMIGDMFNNGLKANVDALCNALSNALATRRVFAEPPQQQGQGGGVSFQVSGSGWPAELGQSTSQGSQNAMSYAVFPATRRLAVSVGGQITVYDTGDHQIGGVGQQQGGDQSLTFTSQFGLVRLADLPVVPLGGAPAPDPAWTPDPQPGFSAPPVAEVPEGPAPVQAPMGSTGAQDDIFSQIERLADLHGRGILSDDEYQSKKADLLSRL